MLIEAGAFMILNHEDSLRLCVVARQEYELDGTVESLCGRVFGAGAKLIGLKDGKPHPPDAKRLCWECAYECEHPGAVEAAA